jgi:hypothetical protein
VCQSKHFLGHSRLCFGHASAEKRDTAGDSTGASPDRAGTYGRLAPARVYGRVLCKF